MVGHNSEQWQWPLTKHILPMKFTTDERQHGLGTYAGPNRLYLPVNW